MGSRYTALHGIQFLKSLFSTCALVMHLTLLDIWRPPSFIYFRFVKLLITYSLKIMYHIIEDF